MTDQNWSPRELGPVLVGIEAGGAHISIRRDVRGVHWIGDDDSTELPRSRLGLDAEPQVALTTAAPRVRGVGGLFPAWFDPRMRHVRLRLSDGEYVEAKNDQGVWLAALDERRLRTAMIEWCDDGVVYATRTIGSLFAYRQTVLKWRWQSDT